MKVLVLVVVLGLLASSAQAVDYGQCALCIIQNCLPCKSDCLPNPITWKCALCVLRKCSPCIAQCVKKVTMMADFGNGMETREFCECPTAQETETEYIPQRWRRPIY